MSKDYPQSEDKLFIEETDSMRGAWISNPASRFFRYSEGYKEAGKILYDACIENSFYCNILIYPLIFNYRQYLELRLKELLIMGNKYVETGEDFPDEHGLTKLWLIYRTKLLPQIESSIEDQILDNVERLINEFNTKDPKSMSFRYPVTRGPNRVESVNMQTINIENFKTSMDKLIYFFEWQWDMISHYEDFKQDMLADMYGEYH